MLDNAEEERALASWPLFPCSRLMLVGVGELSRCTEAGGVASAGWRDPKAARFKCRSECRWRRRYVRSSSRRVLRILASSFP